jgi:hypothetical protein
LAANVHWVVLLLIEEDNMLDKKLQLKDGQTIAVVNKPTQVNLQLPNPETGPDVADAVLVFSIKEADLRRELSALSAAIKDGKLTWLAYPKAKQLDTDLNRNIIRSIANENGLDPVRQIAIDDTWSALRLKLL